jgi:hypothetical protein
MYFSQDGNTVGACGLREDWLRRRRAIINREAEMQDRESQSDVNPGNVERKLDEAPVEREGLQGGGGVEREGMQDGEVEREGLRGGPVTERERTDDGSGR